MTRKRPCIDCGATHWSRTRDWCTPCEDLRMDVLVRAHEQTRELETTEAICMMCGRAINPTQLEWVVVKDTHACPHCSGWMHIDRVISQGVTQVGSPYRTRRQTAPKRLYS